MTKSAKVHAEAPPAGASKHFAMQKPCDNCPFRKEGAIDLAPGRLDGIKQDLLDSDWTTFQCHKTTHRGEWNEDSGDYLPSGEESMCVGAGTFLHAIHRPNIAMRLGYIHDLLPPYDEFVDLMNVGLPPKEGMDE